ncbi:helix-turn-helix transcriptional regulator [Streptomyces rubellomurinus]|uniref:helix-turn-helix transcriptional regulator n=1 Tax=Streptomyces rubellomurinus (strain ATCC 31215) TaxID=359131 RepID=UPI000A6E9D93|nr:hypothetical protein [Streptomyces rubellomurinus]
MDYVPASSGSDGLAGARWERQEGSGAAVGRSGAVQAEEAELALTLSRARELLDSVESFQRRGPSSGRSLAIEDQPALEAALATMVGGGVRQVSVSVPDTGAAGELMRVALAGRRVAAVEPATLRVLCDPRSVGRGPVREAVRAADRCELRVTESALREAVVLDSSAALVWSGSGAGERRVSVVRDAAVVGALTSLYAVAWAGALRYADRPGPDSRARSQTGLRILECLRAGQTDEVAARVLRLSLRTYRRYVAEIMRELDAGSRFQAGARAVELGLVSTSA